MSPVVVSIAVRLPGKAFAVRRSDQVCESQQPCAPITVHTMVLWLSRALITPDSVSFDAGNT
jgi:hypothetical protein